MQNATCRGCGGVLAAQKYRGNPRVWCSNACRVRSYYADKDRPAYTPKVKTQCVVHFFNCSECSALFTARRRDVLYCSRACREAASYRIAVAKGLLVRRRAASVKKFCSACGVRIRNGGNCKPCGIALRAKEAHREARRRGAERKASRAADGVAANPRWPFVNGVCDGCGEAFTRRGHASAYCSRKCRPRTEYTFKISKTTRRAIYERDLWICQLCFRPVDSGLPYTDIWSATLDHIVCKSWTESPDDSPENLRLAHRWCNAVRGDESYRTEADLRVRMNLQEVA